MVHATQTTILEHGAEDFDAKADELVLRVCSPARRGQIVRLRARKCTIGSSRNCTLRLAARGVQPVHCLIVRAEKATIIRCWAADTRINGHSFTDANLNVGDRLSVGPIEFEVLHTATPDGTPSDTQDPSSQLEDQQKSFQEEKQHWEKELASQKAEIQRLHEQFNSVQEAENQRLWQAGEELDSRAAGLDQRRESLGKQQEELVQQAESLQKQREERESERTEEESSQTATSINAEQMGASSSESGISKSAAPECVEVDSHEDEEESIDSYMARLMDRARTVTGLASNKPSTEKGGNVLAPATATHVFASRPGKQPATNSQPETLQPAQSDVEPKKQATAPGKLKDLSPRGVAPEQSTSLSAMRELATVSARSAINRHAKHQFRHAARSKLLVAGIGLASGSILMYFWWVLGERGPFFYGGLISFLVALIWGFQFSIVSGKVAVTQANITRMTGIPPKWEEGEVSDDFELPEH